MAKLALFLLSSDETSCFSYVDGPAGKAGWEEEQCLGQSWTDHGQ